jgi:hypothetical protein
MSTKTIVLPSGASAVLRDASTIKQGDRRKVYASFKDDSDVQTGIAVVDAVIAVMVESWTLDLLPPSVKIESLDELTLPDYDALQAEATEFMAFLFPALGKSPETEADPKALTEDFNG